MSVLPLLRLTFSSVATNTSQPSQSQPVKHRRRVYRWGEMWGILDHDGSWRVEERRTVHETDAPFVLLEEVRLQSVSAPPLHVDDVWEEEVAIVGDLEDHGDLLSICLPDRVLMAWAKQKGITLPVAH